MAKKKLKPVKKIKLSVEEKKTGNKGWWEGEKRKLNPREKKGYSKEGSFYF